MTIEELRKECEEEYCPNWVSQAVRDQVWERAWEHGHSSGFHDVKFYYDDFMDIVRASLGTNNP